MFVYYSCGTATSFARDVKNTVEPASKDVFRDREFLVSFRMFNLVTLAQWLCRSTNVDSYMRGARDGGKILH